MSHNTILINSAAPSASGLISPQVERASHYSTAVSAPMGSITSTAGKAYSWRKVSQATVLLASGFSIALSPRRNTSVNSNDWYELINVPSGTWWVELKIGVSEASPAGAQVALYNNSTGAIVSNIVAFRDRNRSALLLAKITGGVSYEVRIVSGSMNFGGTDRATGVSGWHIKRIE